MSVFFPGSEFVRAAATFMKYAAQLPPVMALREWAVVGLQRPKILQGMRNDRCGSDFIRSDWVYRGPDQEDESGDDQEH